VAEKEGSKDTKKGVILRKERYQGREDLKGGRISREGGYQER
jgi:hypothetical protein